MMSNKECTGDGKKRKSLVVHGNIYVCSVSFKESMKDIEAASFL